MALIKVAIIDASDVVDEDELFRVVAALQKQVKRDFAPVWGVDADLEVMPRGVNPPSGYWWLAVVDDADMANSLGYHDVTSEGLPISKVFARTAKLFNKPWSAAASHELLEMLIDPALNLTAIHQTPFDVRQNTVGRLYGYEICDPCQGGAYTYDIDGVRVADFLYPAWFESFHQDFQNIQFDHVGAIQEPFQILPGGYAGVYDMTSGTGWQQVSLAAEEAAPQSVDEAAMNTGPVDEDARPAVGSRRERRRTAENLRLRSAPRPLPARTHNTRDGRDMSDNTERRNPDYPGDDVDRGESGGDWAGGSDWLNTGDNWSEPAGGAELGGDEGGGARAPRAARTRGRGASSDIPPYLTGDPRQKSFFRYAEGIGRVRPDGRGLSIAMNVYDMDGNPDGQQICNGEVSARSLDELLRQPRRPNVNFEHNGAIEEVPVTTRCQATWRFNDGSTLTAIGKGTSHIVPLRPGIVSRAFGRNIRGAGVMADAAVMVVTHGTGQYAGARGHVLLDSQVTLPDLNNVPFGKPGTRLQQKSVHTFRVYTNEDVSS